jgi:hypothetical protein
MGDDGRNSWTDVSADVDDVLIFRPLLADSRKGQARIGQAGLPGADRDLGQPSADGRDLQGCADGRESSFQQDSDLVRHLFGLGHVMCGQDDGGARGMQLPHQVVQLDARSYVEACRRLVQEEHRRVVGHGQGKREASLLASGELVELGLSLFA